MVAIHSLPFSQYLKDLFQILQSLEFILRNTYMYGVKLYSLETFSTLALFSTYVLLLREFRLNTPQSKRDTFHEGRSWYTNNHRRYLWEKCFWNTFRYSLFVVMINVLSLSYHINQGRWVHLRDRVTETKTGTTHEYECTLESFHELRALEELRKIKMVLHE